MKIYVLDSNIIFSTVFNPNSAIGQFVMSANEQDVEFYAPDYLKIEVERYVTKIVQLSQQPEEKVKELIQLAYTKINFISDDQIPIEAYMKAAPLVRDIDPDDIVFVALNEYLEELLWTGDLKLYRGLLQKGYTKVVTFQDIQEHFR